MSSKKQNAHLTYKANKGIGRHDWLRLTPAYSVKLVQDELSGVSKEKIVFDPFSGTGTTGLCAAELGHHAYLLDVNPFLIWLATTKTSQYNPDEIDEAEQILSSIVDAALSIKSKDMWVPPIHNIERWWSPPSLLALARLRIAIENIQISEKVKQLFLVGFCDVLIKESNASFNHQSMSFKQAVEHEDQLKYSEKEVFEKYKSHMRSIVDSAKLRLEGSVTIIHGDARNYELPEMVDLVITSPPYVNRMSYIRELRPYMYWLKYLELPKDAGELDWKAIGGTWGTATSKLNTWSDERKIPIKEIDNITDMIANAHDKHGKLLANYVYKYFYDMWDHFVSTFKIMKPGAKAVYIVGNSTFYGNIVPAEEWYKELMEHTGFIDCSIEVIRKRNSNKALYEYAVRGTKPDS